MNIDKIAFQATKYLFLFQKFTGVNLYRKIGVNNGKTNVNKCK